MKFYYINGPCGAGKTTVSKLVHDAMPLSYLIDGDAVQRAISHYSEYTTERRELRDAVILGMMDAALRLGRTVVLEKMYYEAETIDQLRAMAEKHGAEVIEVVLWGSKELIIERTHGRGFREGGLLTPEKVENFWERIKELNDGREEMHVVEIEGKTPEELAEEILAL